jgi:hypothetical protein
MFEQRSDVEQVLGRPGSYSVPETPLALKKGSCHGARWAGESFRSRWSHGGRDSHFRETLALNAAGGSRNRAEGDETLDLLSIGRRSTISRGAFGIDYDKRAG